MAVTAPLTSAAPHKGLLASYPLTFFFLLAFAFTWIAWSPWILSEDGVGLLPYKLGDTASGLLNTAAIFLGPTVSAVIMTATTEGRAGIRRLLRRIVLWRVGLRWYLFAFIGVPLVMALGTIIVPGGLALGTIIVPGGLALGTIIVPGGLASFQSLGLGYVLTYLALFIPIAIQGGPLGEEIGWRGFALPRMQPLHGPLVGSIILGLLWGLWHLPQFFVPDWAATSGGSDLLAIVKFVMFAIAGAIVFTWVFNNTRGSVLMAILVHTSIDAFSMPIGLLFSPSEAMNSMLLSFGVVALLVVALTRGRLGYQHYQQEEEPDPATTSM